MKQAKSIVFLLITISISLNVSANIGLVAEPGLPAPGFAPGYIYWSSGKPVMGRSGKIAFTGAADVSLGSTPDNTEAIWTGYPGQLYPVIKEGESPIGFPPNIVFSSMQNGPLFVTKSGMVVAQAYFVGAVNVRGLIVAIDGSTTGIIKTGDQAPGFANGINISGSSFSNIVATDAGVAFLSTTTSGEIGAWFWDSQTKIIDLVAKSSGDASAAYPGCSYFAIPFGLPYRLTMNDAGDIAFVAQLTGTGCPLNAIMRWNRGVLVPVVSKDDPVPGFPANVVTNGLVAPVPSNFQINDVGAITFASALLDQNTFKTAESLWIVHKNGTRELIAIDGEIMPNETIPFISQLWVNNYTNASGRTVLDVLTSDSLEHSILFGPPKTTFSYPDLVDVGTSHLGKLLGATDQPPGFGVTWFYDTINSIAFNNQNTIAISALIKDALDINNSATQGIWKGKDASSLNLVAKQGMTIKINGADETLTELIPFTSGSTNGGQAVHMSDSGQIIFMGASTASALGPAFAGSIFITPALTRDDIVIDFGGIGLWAWMNDANWSKLNNASPDDVITGDVDGNGIDDVIADFTGTIGGIFIKRNGGAWAKLHNGSTQSMTTGDLDGNGQDDIVIDFGVIGLWARMNDSSWLKLNNNSPDQVVITDMDGNGDEDVVADFGSTLGGLFVKRNGGAWAKLHNTSPVTMATGDLDANGSGDVIINFGGIGLWARMNNAAWLKLHNGSPDSIVSGDVDGNGADDVVASFGSSFGGVWQKLNLGGWSKLNNNAPDQMVMGDIDANGQSDLIGAFNSTLGGIFVHRNNGVWLKLHNNNPDDLAVGGLDGI